MGRWTSLVTAAVLRSPDGPFELTELELIEVSLVTLPMQPRARVHMVAG